MRLDPTVWNLMPKIPTAAQFLVKRTGMCLEHKISIKGSLKLWCIFSLFTTVRFGLGLKQSSVFKSCRFLALHVEMKASTSPILKDYLHKKVIYNNAPRERLSIHRGQGSCVPWKASLITRMVKGTSLHLETLVIF